MIISLQLTPHSYGVIRRHALSAARAMEAFAGGLNAAVVSGAEDLRKNLTEGKYGLTMRHPASGLAASVAGWMVDPTVPMGAIGVPANSPAAAYAAIHETGGTIYPKQARALAVPVSEIAKKFSSPRDMANLTMIRRPGKPPLLVEKAGTARGSWKIHWVLLPSVTIPARPWLAPGVSDAMGAMVAAFQGRLNDYVESWSQT